MKQLLFIFLVCTNLAQALVIETDSILSILTYILQDHCKNRNKLVIFDLDDTIIAPSADITSSRWIEYMAKKIMEDEKVSYEDAWQQATDLNDSILETMLLKPVEEVTPALIIALQQAGIPVIALTARPKKSASRTQVQLQMIGIDFSLSPFIPKKEIEIGKKIKAWYENGIIFSGHNNKGTALMAFFKCLDWSPKHIIFIDDSKKRVDEVEQALMENNFNCVVFHYTHALMKKNKVEGKNNHDQV